MEGFMLYIKRKIDQFLFEWKKNQDRLPLVIKGARQVGKTESINKFARNNYKNVIYINFVESRNIKPSLPMAIMLIILLSKFLLSTRQRLF
jgi:predicted AAA+ superfamily ATPase